MQSESRHIGVVVGRPVERVYAFAADPQNLPRWAAGLAGAQVRGDGRRWVTDSPMGPVTFTFAPPNDFGVLDHEVTLPSGQTTYNAVRVIRAGQGCEVVFTLRRDDGMSEAEFERDAATIGADLERLKSILETDTETDAGTDR